MATRSLQSELAPVKVSSGKIAGGELSQRFADALDELLWRPKRSGRQHDVQWLKELLRQAQRQSNGRVTELRHAYASLLRDEDLENPRHMSQVAPSSHLRSVWAYRVWPDKVQALVVLDRLARPAEVPAAVRDGLWQPVALHTPRFTVVEIVPVSATLDASVDSEGWALHFAETSTALIVPSLSDATLKVQRAGRGPEDRQRAAVVLRQLECVRLVFADPEPYLCDMLAPLLLAHPEAPAAALPTSGLCTHALLESRPMEEGADACLDWLRKEIAEERHKLRAYIESIRFDFRPCLTDKLDGLAPQPWSSAPGSHQSNT